LSPLSRQVLGVYHQHLNNGRISLILIVGAPGKIARVDGALAVEAVAGANVLLGLLLGRGLWDWFGLPDGDGSASLGFEVGAPCHVVAGVDGAVAFEAVAVAGVVGAGFAGDGGAYGGGGRDFGARWFDDDRFGGSAGLGLEVGAPCHVVAGIDGAVAFEAVAVACVVGAGFAPDGSAYGASNRWDWLVFDLFLGVGTPSLGAGVDGTTAAEAVGTFLIVACATRTNCGIWEGGRGSSGECQKGDAGGEDGKDCGGMHIGRVSRLV